MEVAGEMVWISRITALRAKGQTDLADKIFAQQYRRDEEGMIYVELDGTRLDLGHVSQGFEQLVEMINKLSA